MIAFILFLTLFLVLAYYIARYTIRIYNSLVFYVSNIEKSKSDIDIQLKRRSSLISNMISIAREYASHEKNTLSEVIDNRNPNKYKRYKSSKSSKTKSVYEPIADTFKSIYKLTEAYPNLKANENFMVLNSQLNNIEQSILNSRDKFNRIVTEYNVIVRSFPSNIIASIFKFKNEQVLQFNENELDEIKI